MLRLPTRGMIVCGARVNHRSKHCCNHARQHPFRDAVFVRPQPTITLPQYASSVSGMQPTAHHKLLLRLSQQRDSRAAASCSRRRITCHRFRGAASSLGLPRARANVQLHVPDTQPMA
eukprot:COSAG02_NODE_6674_length_3426_cov_3.171626_1_plen_117_part_10